MRYFLGNLNWKLDAEQIKSFIEDNGLRCSDVHVVCDRDDGRSKGFGFAEIPDADPQHVISMLNGQTLAGRELRIDRAMPRTR